MRVRRFSLRILLLAFTIGCLLLGYWVQKSRTELAAQQAVRAFSGNIRFVHQMHPERSRLGFFVQDNPTPGPLALRSRLGDHYFARINAVSFWNPTNSPVPEMDNHQLAELIARLEPLRQLRNLQVNCMHVTFDGLQPMARLQRVENLHLDVVRLGDRRLEFLSEMRGLRQLSIHNTRASGSFLRFLTELPRLTELHLSGENLSDENLSTLQELKHLKRLRLTGRQLTGTALAAVAKLDKLEHLQVSSEKLTDDSLRWLATSSVRSVHLNADLTDRVFEHLATIQNLELIIIATERRLTGEGFAYLCDHPALRKLRVSSISPTPESFASLSKIPSLDHLELNCGVGDQHVEHLKRLKGLRTLEID